MDRSPNAATKSPGAILANTTGVVPQGGGQDARRNPWKARAATRLIYFFLGTKDHRFAGSEPGRECAFALAKVVNRDVYDQSAPLIVPF